ncbi:MAG: hypothetical protein F6J87_09230 [Spirulina sp. SIO3F2]|nr:hypothetical protein [Spirulina sp. SIO3F2]
MKRPLRQPLNPTKMILERFCSALALTVILSFYCDVVQAEIIPELETQAVATSSTVGRALPTKSEFQPNGEALNPATASELPKLRDRWAARFQTGTELGESSAFGEVSVFIPFSQVPGESTFFFEGQMRLFTHDAAYGGNARIGYRQFDAASDLVWGGYVGVDQHRTEFRNTFWQLGLGAEVLAKDWEARFNAYLPLGDARQEIVPLRRGEFSGYQLLITRTAEVAMTGFDLEAGYKFLDWDGGQLYGYLNPYFLSAQGAGSFVGVRGRLLAEFGDRYQAGLAISSDGNFGTNISFQIAALLGGRSPRNPDESTLTRLGQPVRRQNTIAIDRQDITKPAINPDTGEEYRFIHVTDGATGGNGTVENPFGEVTSATAIAATAGNDIVYVDAGDRSGMNGFTIPDQVRVLSTGVSHFADLKTQVAGLSDAPFTFQLPGSGTGTLPLIESTITMGNSTTVSGFEIQPPSRNRGVDAIDVSDVTIDRNQITTTSSDAHGIFVQATKGTVSNATISDNTVATSGGEVYSIYALANSSSTLRQTTISGNTVTVGGGESTGIDLRAHGGTISNTTVANNSISTTQNFSDGIFTLAFNNGTINNTTLSGNTVSIAGDNSDGMDVRASTGGIVSNTTIVNNAIATTGNRSNAISLYSSNGTAIRHATIRHNSISTVGTQSNGIYAYIDFGSSVNDITIASNSIATTNNQAQGIYLYTYYAIGLDRVTISSNTIATTGSNAHGIFVSAYGTSVNNTSITNNTVSTVGNGANGINMRIRKNGLLNTTTISSNTVSTLGEEAVGIQAYANQGTINNTTISSNSVTVSGAEAPGIQIMARSGGTINYVDMLGNTVSTSGSLSDGITALINSGGTLNNAKITNNSIQQAGQHSILVGTLFNASSTLCIADFSGNTSRRPNVFGGGGNDLNLTVFTGSTVSFVDFANVGANNTGFDDISGSPTSTPSGCP